MLQVMPFLLSAGLGLAEAPEPIPVEPVAHLQTVRWGRTSSGATRVVFQLDRGVEFLTVELADDNGLEVHLLGAELGPAREPLRADGRIVSEIFVRPDTSGTIARIQSAGPRLSARSFKLTNPARVVVDVRASSTSSSPSRRVATTRDDDPNAAAVRALDAPAPVQKTEHAERTGAPSESGFIDGVAATRENPAPTASTDSVPGEFDEFLTWVQGIKFAVEALLASETETDRAKYRRTLAYRLAERGVLAEAARTLQGAVESEGRDKSTAPADSLYLAELRLSLGNREGASSIARALPTAAATPQQRVRVARILSKTGFPTLAEPLLEGAMPLLEAREQPEATLLLARCLWDQQKLADARKITTALTSARNTPPAVLASATVLHADCLWSLGMIGEAEDFYRRATGYRLDDHEASWTSLQLGNVARREGRIGDAISHYRETVEKWPESYYATQADWFLRVAEETERLRASDAARNRG